jgi:hypothetical protein
MQKRRLCPSVDMASDAPGSCRARKRIPTDQWDAKRPIITKLYQEEKRPLKEVMDILEKEHGFTATCVSSLPLTLFVPRWNCGPTHEPNQTAKLPLGHSNSNDLTFLC